ncbi:hypothetical protein TNCV_1063521 [Trichonephila clavipes]|nr:hypothetical protein TNCV_1063521 [Trichonephila clavipes]
MKLLVRLINTTNERRLVQGHETPLRIKWDIKDVSSELDNGCYFALLGRNDQNSSTFDEPVERVLRFDFDDELKEAMQGILQESTMIFLQPRCRHAAETMEP